MTTKVGFIGWRGMVGSVLMERMRDENDFQNIESYFFTTSQIGQEGPDVGQGSQPLSDAFAIDELETMEIIITCQGGDYTKEVHSKLREAGWKGYWIDAASALRMKDDAVLVLDPVNRAVIDKALQDGVKDLIGSNCTVSTMLMGLSGLFENDLVEWVSSMTYQAASGAGSRNMMELLSQMKYLGDATETMIVNPASSILDIDKKVNQSLIEEEFPTEFFGAALAANALPWIDREVEGGMSREEWKGQVETNKILATKNDIPVDGTCVRIGSMRSHAHGLTIKLKNDVPLDEIEDMLASAHSWVDVVPNNKQSTINNLTPAAVSGSLSVRVGRLRKMTLGNDYLNAFTVGDQLLWGAAEPLRRAMNIVLENK